VQQGHFKLWAAGLGVALSLGAAQAGDWQRKALELYPQLGVADSAFNKKFHQLRRQQELGNPDYFNNPQWPVWLARECAAQLAAAAKPAASPAVAARGAPNRASPVAPGPIAGEKLYQAKCGRCHDLPGPRFIREETWNRWMMSMRYKAGLNDEEYEQMMDYARRDREQRPAPPPR